MDKIIIGKKGFHIEFEIVLQLSDNTRMIRKFTDYLGEGMGLAEDWNAENTDYDIMIKDLKDYLEYKTPGESPVHMFMEDIIAGEGKEVEEFLAVKSAKITVDNLKKKDWYEFYYDFERGK